VVRVLFRDPRYSKDCIKLADFGVAHISKGSDDTLCKTAGTPAFMAPESLSVETTHFEGRPVDLWAMGVTLYCLLFGKVPFEGGTPMQLYTKIRNEPPALEAQRSPPLSPALLHTLTCLMIKEPAQRITTLQLREDPWTTHGNATPITPSVEINCAFDENEGSFADLDGECGLTLANVHLTPGSGRARQGNMTSRAHTDPGLPYSASGYAGMDENVAPLSKSGNHAHPPNSLFQASKDAAGACGQPQQHSASSAPAGPTSPSPHPSPANAKAFYLTRLTEFGGETMIAHQATADTKGAISIDALRRPATAFRYQQTYFKPPSAAHKKAPGRPHSKIQKILAARKLTGSIV